MRVGLTQRVVNIPAYGERRDTLDQRWMQFSSALSIVPILLPNLADAGYLEAVKLEAVILTGGNDIDAPVERADAAPERDAFERSLLSYCMSKNLPVIGICRGMQMLQVYGDGLLEKIDGHAGIRHDIRWSVDAPSAFRSSNVNSFHNIGIAKLSSQYRPLAWAPDGSCEAAVHEVRPWLGIMWHPEREALPQPADVALIGHYLQGANK